MGFEWCRFFSCALFLYISYSCTNFHGNSLFQQIKIFGIFEFFRNKTGKTFVNGNNFIRFTPTHFYTKKFFTRMNNFDKFYDHNAWLQQTHHWIDIRGLTHWIFEKLSHFKQTSCHINILSHFPLQFVISTYFRN